MSAAELRVEARMDGFVSAREVFGSGCGSVVWAGVLDARLVKLDERDRKDMVELVPVFLQVARAPGARILSTIRWHSPALRLKTETLR